MDASTLLSLADCAGAQRVLAADQVLPPPRKRWNRLAALLADHHLFRLRELPSLRLEQALICVLL
jgi:hypothetical protein